MAELPAEFLGRMADLTTHRIEGYITPASRFGVTEDQPFSMPIITQVDGNLWQGGCPAPELPDYFKHVLNLYPWEGYRYAAGTEVRTERLYDSTEVPSAFLLEGLAIWVNERRKDGPTLVHCQAGLNRSALVTGLALIRSGMKAADAVALLRKRSPMVLCNKAFEQWLLKQR